MKDSKPPKIVCVCGTTASGKSDLSLALSSFACSPVICIDSAQAFKHADIGSAKISLQKRSEIEHKLLDLVDPGQRLEAGSFIKLATKEIEKVSSLNALPLLCVGTSLYFRLMLEGMAETGPGNLDLRAKLEQLSTQELYQQLLDTDSLRAETLHRNDRVRIIRALEIFETSGQKASQLYAQQKRALNYEALLIILVWDRTTLGKRIRLRSEAMLSEGLVEECKYILDKYGPSSQVFENIGYQEVLQYLLGQISEKDAIELISIHTQQLAKRQLSFWRRFPAKSGFQLSPEQSFMPKASPKKMKSQQIEIESCKLKLTDIISEMHRFKEEGGLRAIYIDAEYLFQSAGTIAD